MIKVLRVHTYLFMLICVDLQDFSAILLMQLQQSPHLADMLVDALRYVCHSVCPAVLLEYDALPRE